MIEFIVSYLIILPLYIWSSYPSVPGGDAGELLAEACHLGIPHPPGYPLLTMLWYAAIMFGKFIGYVITWTVSYLRYYFYMEVIIAHEGYSLSPSKIINLLCCVLGASTCYILGKTVKLYLVELSRHSNGDSSHTRRVSVLTKPGCFIGRFLHFISVEEIHGAIASVMFGLSPLSIEYSIGAEVFVLNNLLVALILSCTLQVSIAATNYMDIMMDRKASRVGQTNMDETFRDDSLLNENSRLVEKESMKGALLCGLALSNQHTSLLFILPLTIYVLRILHQCKFTRKALSHERKIGHTNVINYPLHLLKLVFLLAIGLSPYLYLVIVGSTPPKRGSWGDLSTWRGLLRHVSRSEYGTFSLGASKFHDTEGSVDRWIAYGHHICTQFSYLGVLCLVLGLLRVWKVEWQASIGQKKRQTKVGTVVLMTGCFYLVIWNGLFSNLPLSGMAGEVLSRFYMQPNLIACFFIGVGSYTTLIFVAKDKLHQLVAGMMFLSVTLVSDRGGAKLLTNRDHNWIIHAYGKSILDSLPENALLLSFSDLNWNSVRYFQTCEGSRDDVIHLSLQLMPYPWFKRQIETGMYRNEKGPVIFPTILPNVSTAKGSEGYATMMSRFLHSNIDQKIAEGGIFIEMQGVVDSSIGVAGRYLDDFVLIPWGLVFRVLPLDVHTEKPFYGSLRQNWHRNSMELIKNTRQHMLRYTRSFVLRSGSWEFAAISVFWDSHYQLSLHLLSLALDLKPHIKDHHELIEVYFHYVKLSSKLLWQVDRALERQNTISHLESDVVKNTALAHMQYYNVAKTLPTLNRHIPNLPDVDGHELRLVSIRTKHAVGKYLSIFTYDNDTNNYGVFEQFFSHLITEEDMKVTG